MSWYGGRHVDLERFKGWQAAWLRHDRLLSRPWFVLASAPNPTLPTVLPPDTAHIHVKYAGHTASRLGLPVPDLTFLLEKTRPDQISGLRFGKILKMTGSRPELIANRLRLHIPGIGQQEMRISKWERDAMLNDVLGDVYVGTGSEKRPSNGISMLCYALILGVPQIILTGFSISTDGHSYATNVRSRRHKEEDAISLATIAAKYPQVWTTEPALHHATNLKLYQP